MEIRRKKQHVVAGIAMLAIGIACANPLPAREIGTVPTDVPAVKADASMPTDMPRSAIVCNAGTLNFRTDPGTANVVQNTYPDGTAVTLLDALQTTPDGALWQKTDLGWANSRFLCVLPAGDFPNTNS